MPVLAALHWLPREKRVDFKILLTTFKALHDLAPEYIRDLIIPYLPLCSLRSLNLSLLRKPRSKTKTFVDHSFVVCSPQLWNKLTCHLRQLDELEAFMNGIKTHLYKQAYAEI